MQTFQNSLKKSVASPFDIIFANCKNCKFAQDYISLHVPRVTVKIGEIIFIVSKGSISAYKAEK